MSFARHSKDLAAGTSRACIVKAAELQAWQNHSTGDEVRTSLTDRDTADAASREFRTSGARSIGRRLLQQMCCASPGVTEIVGTPARRDLRISWRVTARLKAESSYRASHVGPRRSVFLRGLLPLGASGAPTMRPPPTVGRRRSTEEAIRSGLFGARSGAVREIARDVSRAGSTAGVL